MPRIEWRTGRKLELSLETHEIIKMVITAAIDQKNASKEELSNKFVSLKWMAVQNTGLIILP